MTLPLHSVVKHDFSAMTEATFNHLNGGGFKHNWHHDLIGNEVERILAGETTRLILTVPPGFLKSTTMSVALSAYLLGLNPRSKIIAASYSSALAEIFSEQTRDVMQAPWYKKAFPQTRIKIAQADRLTTSLHGSRIATSVTGRLTGLRADVIIVDDPLNFADVFFVTRRQEVNNWIDNLATRLDDPDKGILIVVMQRVHLDDPVAHLLAKGNWRHIKLPLIAQEAQDYDCGGYVHRRKAGDLLHPEHFSAEAAERQRKEIGEVFFQAMYQQEPMASSELIVPFDRFRPCDKTWPDAAIIQSWDEATTHGAGDYSVVTTWMCKGEDSCLMDIDRMQVDFPTLKSRIRAWDEKWKPGAILIESAGLGTPLHQDLRRSGMLHVHVTGNKLNGRPLDKVSRLQLVSGQFEAGHVFISSKIKDRATLRQEWNAFPDGKHDDQVDSITQFLLNRNRVLSKIRPVPNWHKQGSTIKADVIRIPAPRAPEWDPNKVRMNISLF